MNPAFFVLVIIGAVVLWGLLSLPFISIEDILSWLSDDADDEIKEKEKEENEK